MSIMCIDDKMSETQIMKDIRKSDDVSFRFIIDGPSKTQTTVEFTRNSSGAVEVRNLGGSIITYMGIQDYKAFETEVAVTMDLTEKEFTIVSRVLRAIRRVVLEQTS